MLDTLEQWHSLMQKILTSTIATTARESYTTKSLLPTSLILQYKYNSGNPCYCACVIWHTAKGDNFINVLSLEHQHSLFIDGIAHV